MRKVTRVALAFPLEHPHLGRVAAGIKDYARDHGEWTLALAPETRGASLRSLRGWPGDGVIALVNNRADARVARQMQLPVVNISGALRNAGVPCVTDDQLAVGRMAADHLLDCGFRRFGYYGLRGVWYAQQRGRGFSTRIEQHGGRCSLLEAPSNLTPRWPWQYWVEPLEQWLRTLEPPVGLMATLDVRATVVLDACHRLGLSVPDDVAVIGVNNSESACQLSHPAISSIARNGYQIGYQAAGLLDRLMARKPLLQHEILVPPDGVVKRASTDVVAVEDPHVAVAVRFIREHAGEPFGVERLLRLAPVSRRWLEQRFKHCLGRTPHEFICRTRVERAKQLLIGPEKLKLKQVADACGFSDTMRFRLVFQRLTGTTPAEYRSSHRAQP